MINRIFLTLLFTCLVTTMGFTEKATNNRFVNNGNVSTSEEETWVISTSVTVTEPMQVGNVTVVEGGILTVSGVQEPGFKIAGTLRVTGHGTVNFNNSVIQNMSTYHNQYMIISTGNGQITISQCNFRVPAGWLLTAIQIFDDSQLIVQDSNFPLIQFLAAGRSQVTAMRLNANLECVIFDEGSMMLSDIPRQTDGGFLWVWPTFMPKSKATYSPPSVGFVSSFTFPPTGSSGILMSYHIERCQVASWPIMVREGSELTLENISLQNRVTVGLMLPSATRISGLKNRQTFYDTTLDLPDRVLRLQNATIETWNIYTKGQARIVLQDCLVGEVAVFDQSSLVMENCTVDGSGGFFDVRDLGSAEAKNCIFTCDVQTSGQGTAIIRDSQLLPKLSDPTGQSTCYGSYDAASLHLDRTQPITKLCLGGQGEIVRTWILDPPISPPPKGSPVTIHGTAAIDSLVSGSGLKLWELIVDRDCGTQQEQLSKGEKNIEQGVLGIWEGAKVSNQYELGLIITDCAGRKFKSTASVPHTISTETVSVPNIPSGQKIGIIGTSYTYSTGGSFSNLCHTVEYQFDWKGDGSDLSPWGSSSQSKTWTTAGTYYVRVKARCVMHTTVISDWSSGLAVDIVLPIILQSPLSRTHFNACSLYLLPSFSWSVEETFKSYEIQFSPDQNFSSIPVKIKTLATTTEPIIKLNIWKKILLIPGGNGGSTYWRVVGTRANRTKFTSEARFIIIDPPQPIGNPNILSTSKSGLPTLSWEANCNKNFKAWFGSDEGFSKKTVFAFNIINPNHNEGIFTKLLTTGQWMAIRRVVRNVSGSTIYWYVESWDGLRKYNKTNVMNFVLTD